MAKLEKLKPHPALPAGYLSSSSVSMFLRCPKQFEFRYIEGLSYPPSVAMIEGTSHHIWLADNNEKKMETGEDQPKKEMLELFSETFFEKAQEVGDITPGGEKEVLNRGEGLVNAYMDTMAPEIQPKAAEQKFEIEVGGVPVLGFIDLITPKEVLDYKVVKKAKSENEVKDSIQLGLYARATRKPTVGFVSLTKTKVPAAKMTTHRVTNDLKHSLPPIFEGATKAIGAGNFPMTDPSNWWCSDRFCGFWRFCRGKHASNRKTK